MAVRSYSLTDPASTLNTEGAARILDTPELTIVEVRLKHAARGGTFPVRRFEGEDRDEVISAARAFLVEYDVSWESIDLRAPNGGRTR